MALNFLLDRGGMYVYPWYVSELVHTKDLRDIAGGLCVKKSLICIEDDFLSVYYDEKSVNRVGKYFFDRIVANDGFIEEVFENVYKLSDELNSFCDEVRKVDVESLNNDELLKVYSDYVEKLRVLRMWGCVPGFVEGSVSFLTEHLQEELKIFLEGASDSEKFAQHYSVLSSSEKMSEIQMEELARLDLLLELEKDYKKEEIIEFVRGESKNKELDKLLGRHIEKYGWLTYAYSGPVMTKKHLLGLLDDMLKKGGVVEQKNDLLGHYENVRRNKKELVNELNLSDDLVRLFNVSSEMMYIKDYRKGVYQKSYVCMDRVLDELRDRIGISLKEIKYLIFSEVKKALIENKKEYYGKVVKERLKKCCYVTIDGKVKIFQGDECDVIFEKEVEKNVFDVNEENFSGMIAYSGKVEGRVKVVLIESDVEKVTEGDILVSSSTNPDLILAMKKASAFVTETGGIISHAAIVSRELKKPCVVGVKNITKILRDGDLIEVDANEGSVKILKRAKDLKKQQS